MQTPAPYIFFCFLPNASPPPPPSPKCKPHSLKKTIVGACIREWGVRTWACTPSQEQTSSKQVIRAEIWKPSTMHGRCFHPSRLVGARSTIAFWGPFPPHVVSFPPGCSLLSPLEPRLADIRPELAMRDQKSPITQKCEIFLCQSRFSRNTCGCILIAR